MTNKATKADLAAFDKGLRVVSQFHNYPDYLCLLTVSSFTKSSEEGATENVGYRKITIVIYPTI